jgi:hypothetical protein
MGLMRALVSVKAEGAARPRCTEVSELLSSRGGAGWIVATVSQGRAGTAGICQTAGESEVGIERLNSQARN